jgi:hypothetical protein
VGSQIASVGNDAVAHEFVSFVGSEFVYPLPEWTQGSEGFGSICPGIDENSFVVQGTETGIEVVAVRIDQMQGHHWDFQLGKGFAKFFDSKLSRPKTLAAVDARPPGVPEKVTVTFQVIGAQIDLDNLEASLAIPVHIERNLALP